MEKALVISGIGGQGIQVTGQTLGWAAVHEGKRALYFSMFDGAQRGGVSENLVAVAEGRVKSPPVLLQPIDACVALHPNSFMRFEKWIRPGGLMVYNSSIKLGSRRGGENAGEGLGVSSNEKVEVQGSRDDVAYLPVPASEMAQNEVGNLLMAALIALGAFAQQTGVVNIETLQKSLYDAIRPGRHQFVPVSQQALDAGASYVKGNGHLLNQQALSLF